MQQGTAVADTVEPVYRRVEHRDCYGSRSNSAGLAYSSLHQESHSRLGTRTFTHFKFIKLALCPLAPQPIAYPSSGTPYFTHRRLFHNGMARNGPQVD
jgi:hypothetical protein